MEKEKISKKEKMIKHESGEHSSSTPESGMAAKSVFDKFKRQLMTSTILGMGGLSMTVAGQNTENINKQADQKFAKDKNRIEVSSDTIQRKDGQTLIKKTYEVYGEKITDKELKDSYPLEEETRQKYLDREVRAYEPVVIESRFWNLRKNEFAHTTKEESIQYGDKVIKVRLFKEGNKGEFLKYFKKAFGAEADKLIKEWGIDENSYEVLLNLKRDQFVKMITHGKNKELYRWTYLAGGPGNTGTPFVGVVTEQDIFFEGLAGCSANPAIKRVSVTCEEMEIHNSGVLYKTF